MDNNRTLVIGSRWVGDNVVAHCLIQKLYNDNKKPIDYLLPSYSADVARLMPEIENVHVCDFQSGKFEIKKRMNLANSLSEYHYKYAYLIPDTFKYALIPYFAKIPNIIGYSGELRSFMLTEVKPNSNSHNSYAERLVNLACKNKESVKFPIPSLTISTNIIDDSNNKFNLNINDKTIIVSPGSRKKRKYIWSTKNFSKLISLLNKHDYNYIILGSKSDSIYAKEIISYSKQSNILDLTGKTTILEAAAIIKKSFATIANDSGIMHLSAALGIITFGIFTLVDENYWRPLGKRTDCISQPDKQLSANDVYDKFISLINSVESYK